MFTVDRMNAFQHLMHSASQQAASKRKNLKRSSTEQQQQLHQHLHKRPSLCTSSSLQLKESTLSADAGYTSQTTPSQQASASLSSQTTDNVTSHHEAAAAFRRVFSGRIQHRKQKYDYLLVYDLEATCNQSKDLAPVEIIELSCAIVNTHSAEIQASYQAYVRPTEHPQLDTFCLELTGIQQHQVDAAAPLQTVLQQHHDWLQQQGMLDPGVLFVPMTWTNWDLQIALCTECGWRRIQRPDYLCSWVDLKKYYIEKFKRGGNLRSCVEAVGLSWQGRAHSGLDDAMNTARLAIKLMTQGTMFEVTQTSENVPVKQERCLTGADGANSAPVSVASRHNRASMQALAAANGVAGVFDSAGRWTGKCFCKLKAHFRTTKRPGPNHGRQFYACGRWTITQQSEQCEFFLWKEQVPPDSLLPT